MLQAMTFYPAAVLLSLTCLVQDPIPASVAVGPQYDSTHVYVAPDQMDRFVATFGGRSSKPVTVTNPTPSVTISQVVFTRVGFLNVFGFKTPIPYPFGEERAGYLVIDTGRRADSRPSASR